MDIDKNKLVTKRLKEEEIPYELLLLADETVEAINKYIKDSEIYILKIEKKIIAIYVLKIISKDTIEIKNIAVDKNHQGKGLGKFLIRDAIKKAQEKDFRAIIIGTGNSAFKQLYLYQKEGFEMFDIKKDFYIDNCPEPIYENGILLKHMVMLKKELR